MESLSNFLDALEWRVHGQINEAEFSSLYLEWYQKNLYGNINKKLDVLFVRELFLLRGAGEKDLDLYIGLLVYENNKLFADEVVSYLSSPSSEAVSPSRFLEFCGRDWLNLGEDLFFSLDTPGYGMLSHDEILFLTACLIIGQRRWVDESDFYERLSSKELIAATMKLWDGMSRMCECITEDRTERSFPPCISLNGFKRYLIACRVNKAGLSAVVSFVHSSIETMKRTLSVVEEEEEEVLSISMHPIENASALGSPRMWQRAVIEASGYDFGACHIDDRNASPAPLVLLFLLSADAEAYISSDFRLAAITLAGSEDSWQYSPSARKNIRRRFQLQDNVIDMAIVATTSTLWHGFNIWAKGRRGSYAMAKAMSQSYDKTTSDAAAKSFATTGTKEYEYLRHDPVFSMILTSVVEYRILLDEFSASIRDVAATFYGRHGGREDNALGVVCAQLLAPPNLPPLTITITSTNPSPAAPASPVNRSSVTRDVQLLPPVDEAVAVAETDPHSVSPSPLHEVEVVSEQYNDAIPTKENSPVAASTSSTLQVKSPQLYAETLRKILRKMSNKDANASVPVRLQTFENALELGHQIIESTRGRPVRSSSRGNESEYAAIVDPLRAMHPPSLQEVLSLDVYGNRNKGGSWLSSSQSYPGEPGKPQPLTRSTSGSSLGSAAMSGGPGLYDRGGGRNVATYVRHLSVNAPPPVSLFRGSEPEDTDGSRVTPHNRQSRPAVYHESIASRASGGRRLSQGPPQHTETVVVRHRSNSSARGQMSGNADGGGSSRSNTPSSAVRRTYRYTREVDIIGESESSVDGLHSRRRGDVRTPHQPKMRTASPSRTSTEQQQSIFPRHPLFRQSVTTAVSGKAAIRALGSRDEVQVPGSVPRVMSRGPKMAFGRPLVS